MRNLINRINNSNNIYMYCERKKKEATIDVSFKLDFQVRWNTTFMMLNRFLTIRSIVNDKTMNAESIPNLS
jgi:hypothetical protein